MASSTPSTARESGWLPDVVYTGGRFEAGLAFFADPLGRITRFSREPADLAGARRLNGQVVLPGLVNAHSRATHRLLRGAAPGRRSLALAPGDVRDVARMAFLELLLSGVTCVGEFHLEGAQPDGTAWPEAGVTHHEILRAAREVGVRISLVKVAGAGSGPVDRYIREMDALRQHVAREHPGDEVWLGVGAEGVTAVPLEFLKPMGAYAHSHRFRFHLPLAARADEADECLVLTGRRPLALVSEQGLLDKRLMVVHAAHLSADEIRQVGTARAAICACPSAVRSRGERETEIAPFLAADVTVALGTEALVQSNLMEEARQVRDAAALGTSTAARAAALFHAMTVGGARSLGAPSGALEVGRPADFFTVNLFDPSIAGGEPEGLLPALVSSLERRAVREVWMGGRQRLVGGRHPQQGAIVARFVELAKRV